MARARDTQVRVNLNCRAAGPRVVCGRGRWLGDITPTVYIHMIDVLCVVYMCYLAVAVSWVKLEESLEKVEVKKPKVSALHLCWPQFDSIVCHIHSTWLLPLLAVFSSFVRDAWKVCLQTVGVA